MTEYFPRKAGRSPRTARTGDELHRLRRRQRIDRVRRILVRAEQGFPVAKLLNKAGYFTKPDQYNVAVALTQAVIDQNPNSATYLMQKLDNVYVYNDVRTYPLSSYSYMLLPVGTDAQDSRLKTEKRQTLTDFLYYSICVGQQEMGNIGYSPLPINLVNAGFGQLQKLKTADRRWTSRGGTCAAATTRRSSPESPTRTTSRRSRRSRRSATR